MTKFVAPLLIGACSVGMQGVDPKWDGRSEPVCSDSNATIMFDRVMGAAFLVTGVSLVTARQDEPALAVGIPTIALGLLFELGANLGSKTLVECRDAKTRWAYSNAIKPRNPSDPLSTRRSVYSVSQAPAGPGSRPDAVAVPSGKLTGTDRPWAAGVPESEQASALEIYVAGNREFVEAHYAEALAKYKEALRHWDHPAIRFNMAVCLINLDQPVEARDNLERSMVYGAGALNTETYAQGLTHRKLLDAQLVRLTIVCKEPDEEVMLDGKLVFKGPGAADQYVRPGEHQMVAIKRGFLPATKKIVLVAGQPATYEIGPLVDPRPTP